MTVNKSIDCSAKPTTKVMHLYRRQGNYEMWLSRSLRKSSIISLIEEIQDKREACNQDIHRLLSEVLCQNMAFYQLPSSSTWILYVLNMKASSILSENDAVLRNCMTTCDDLFGLFKEHCPDSCGTCADYGRSDSMATCCERSEVKLLVWVWVVLTRPLAFCARTTNYQGK